jgi:hypothetical protein
MRQELHFLIPTRDNALALTSLLATIYPYTDNRKQRVHLHISDGSKRPVIAEPQVSRMLAAFCLHYQHTIEPDPNTQRLDALRDIDGAQAIICVDDDLMLDPMADYEQAVESFIAQDEADAVFGITVDLHNDKGYCDFNRHAGGDHHSFDTAHGEIFKSMPKLAKGFASPGHMLTTAGHFQEALTRTYTALNGKPPEVVDDAAAVLLALRKPLVCTAMVAEHVGNQNHWWNGGGQKQFAVMKLVEELTK